ncbi:UNVERIFIED_CONTAM: Bidirectional sugar transporter SWEET12 [Sesamum latifolium]|uniref:Bidirectional sugar transporter SWEET n=1 Tax=Sesamum latifolium TaxID=2727402 RepID=A0AAW2YE45_9LAMI
MVFLAPIRVSIGPYAVGLFSAMLWIYYAFLKPDTTLLVTINSVGCFIQSAYICFYLFFATRNARVQTVKLLLLLNTVGFGLIMLLTYFLAKGSNRANIVGWICLVFSLCVFVAPLCVVRQVIRTKSVEYMPFLLSFSSLLVLLCGSFMAYCAKTITSLNGKTLVQENQLQLPAGIIAVEDEKQLPVLRDQIIDVMKLQGGLAVEIIPVVSILVDNVDILGGGKNDVGQNL